MAALLLAACSGRSPQEDAGTPLDTAPSCDPTAFCADDFRFAAVGTLPNPAVEVSGTATVLQIGDWIVLATLVPDAGATGNSDLAIFRTTLSGEAELIERLTDWAGPVRSAYGTTTATLIVPRDSSDGTQVVTRYRFDVDGGMSRTSMPLDGAIDVVTSDPAEDLLIEYVGDGSGVRLVRWVWPATDAPRRDTVTADASVLAALPSKQIHILQAAFLQNWVLVVVTDASSAHLLRLDTAMARVTGAEEIAVSGFDTARRMVVAAGNEHESAIVSATRDSREVLFRVDRDSVTTVADIGSELFIRDAAPTADGSVLLLGALNPEGSETGPDGRPNPMASTFVLRFTSTGCLHGADEPAFVRDTTPVAVGSLSTGGVVVVGLRNPGSPGSKVELAIACGDVG